MRLIDAVELQKRIHEHHYILTDAFNTKDLGMFTGGIDYAIQTAPTIDAVPVRHGEWVKDGKPGGYNLYKCTACGELWLSWWAEIVPIERMYKEMPFCPHCGADMRGKDEEK